MKIYLLFVTVVQLNSAIKQTDSTFKSDSPLLMKILQSVDTATSNEHLLNVTLKLLKSLCVCMRETLRQKEERFFNSENNLLENEGRQSYDTDLLIYRKIFNNTCYNLRQELAQEINKTHVISVDHDILPDRGNCGKHRDMTVKPELRNQNDMNFQNLIFNLLFKSKEKHKYKIKSYNLFGKAKIRVENSDRHSVIVIFTLQADKDLQKDEINEETVNDAIDSNTSIDIDIIDAKYDSKEKESKENKSDTVLDCNLKSIYVFLVRSKNAGLVKVFKLLKKNDKIKVYVDITTKRNHTDYTSTCCNNASICRIENSDSDTNTVKNLYSTKSVDVIGNYKDTISKIKSLVKLYDFKLKGNSNLTQTTDIIAKYLDDINFSVNKIEEPEIDIKTINNVTPKQTIPIKTLFGSKISNMHNSLLTRDPNKLDSEDIKLPFSNVKSLNYELSTSGSILKGEKQNTSIVSTTENIYLHQNIASSIKKHLTNEINIIDSNELSPELTTNIINSTVEFYKTLVNATESVINVTKKVQFIEDYSKISENVTLEEKGDFFVNEPNRIILRNNNLPDDNTKSEAKLVTKTSQTEYSKDTTTINEAKKSANDTKFQSNNFSNIAQHKTKKHALTNTKEILDGYSNFSSTKFLPTLNVSNNEDATVKSRNVVVLKNDDISTKSSKLTSEIMNKTQFFKYSEDHITAGFKVSNINDISENIISTNGTNNYEGITKNSNNSITEFGANIMNNNKKKTESSKPKHDISLHSESYNDSSKLNSLEAQARTQSNFNKDLERTETKGAYEITEKPNKNKHENKLPIVQENSNIINIPQINVKFPNEKTHFQSAITLPRVEINSLENKSNQSRSRSLLMNNVVPEIPKYNKTFAQKGTYTTKNHITGIHDYSKNNMKNYLDRMENSILATEKTTNLNSIKTKSSLRYNLSGGKNNTEIPTITLKNVDQIVQDEGISSSVSILRPKKLLFDEWVNKKNDVRSNIQIHILDQLRNHTTKIPQKESVSTNTFRELVNSDKINETTNINNQKFKFSDNLILFTDRTTESNTLFNDVELKNKMDKNLQNYTSVSIIPITAVARFLNSNVMDSSGSSNTQNQTESVIKARQNNWNPMNATEYTESIHKFRSPEDIRKDRSNYMFSEEINSQLTQHAPEDVTENLILKVSKTQIGSNVIDPVVDFTETIKGSINSDYKILYHNFDSESTTEQPKFSFTLKSSEYPFTNENHVTEDYATVNFEKNQIDPPNYDKESKSNLLRTVVEKANFNKLKGYLQTPKKISSLETIPKPDLMLISTLPLIKKYNSNKINEKRPTIQQQINTTEMLINVSSWNLIPPVSSGNKITANNIPLSTSSFSTNSNNSSIEESGTKLTLKSKIYPFDEVRNETTISKDISDLLANQSSPRITKAINNNETKHGNRKIVGKINTKSITTMKNFAGKIPLFPLTSTSERNLTLKWKKELCDLKPKLGTSQPVIFNKINKLRNKTTSPMDIYKTSSININKDLNSKYSFDSKIEFDKFHGKISETEKSDTPSFDHRVKNLYKSKTDLRPNEISNEIDSANYTIVHKIMNNIDINKNFSHSVPFNKKTSTQEIDFDKKSPVTYKFKENKRFLLDMSNIKEDKMLDALKNTRPNIIENNLRITSPMVKSLNHNQILRNKTAAFPSSSDAIFTNYVSSKSIENMLQNAVFGTEKSTKTMNYNQTTLHPLSNYHNTTFYMKKSEQPSQIAKPIPEFVETGKETIKPASYGNDVIYRTSTDRVAHQTLFSIPQAKSGVSNSEGKKTKIVTNKFSIIDPKLYNHTTVSGSPNTNVSSIRSFDNSSELTMLEYSTASTIELLPTTQPIENFWISKWKENIATKIPYYENYENRIETSLEKHSEMTLHSTESNNKMVTKFGMTEDTNVSETLLNGFFINRPKVRNVEKVQKSNNSFNYDRGRSIENLVREEKSTVDKLLVPISTKRTKLVTNIETGVDQKIADEKNDMETKSNDLYKKRSNVNYPVKKNPSKFSTTVNLPSQLNTYSNSLRANKDFISENTIKNLINTVEGRFDTSGPNFNMHPMSLLEHKINKMYPKTSLACKNNSGIQEHEMRTRNDENDYTSKKDIRNVNLGKTLNATCNIRECLKNDNNKKVHEQELELKNDPTTKYYTIKKHLEIVDDTSIPIISITEFGNEDNTNMSEYLHENDPVNNTNHNNKLQIEETNDSTSIIDKIYTRNETADTATIALGQLKVCSDNSQYIGDGCNINNEENTIKTLLGTPEYVNNYRQIDIVKRNTLQSTALVTDVETEAKNKNHYSKTHESDPDKKIVTASSTLLDSLSVPSNLTLRTPKLQNMMSLYSDVKNYSKNKLNKIIQKKYSNRHVVVENTIKQLAHDSTTNLNVYRNEHKAPSFFFQTLPFTSSLKKNERQNNSRVAVYSEGETKSYNNNMKMVYYSSSLNSTKKPRNKQIDLKTAHPEITKSLQITTISSLVSNRASVLAIPLHLMKQNEKQKGFLKEKDNYDLKIVVENTTSTQHVFPKTSFDPLVVRQSDEQKSITKKYSSSRGTSFDSDNNNNILEKQGKEIIPVTELSIELEKPTISPITNTRITKSTNALKLFEVEPRILTNLIVNSTIPILLNTERNIISSAVNKKKFNNFIKSPGSNISFVKYTTATSTEVTYTSLKSNVEELMMNNNGNLGHKQFTEDQKSLKVTIDSHSTQKIEENTKYIGKQHRTGYVDRFFSNTTENFLNTNNNASNSRETTYDKINRKALNYVHNSLYKNKVSTTPVLENSTRAVLLSENNKINNFGPSTTEKSRDNPTEGHYTFQEFNGTKTNETKKNLTDDILRSRKLEKAVTYTMVPANDMSIFFLNKSKSKYFGNNAHNRKDANEALTTTNTTYQSNNMKEKVSLTTSKTMLALNGIPEKENFSKPKMTAEGSNNITENIISNKLKVDTKEWKTQIVTERMTVELNTTLQDNFTHSIISKMKLAPKLKNQYRSQRPILLYELHTKDRKSQPKILKLSDFKISENKLYQRDIKIKLIQNSQSQNQSIDKELNIATVKLKTSFDKKEISNYADYPIENIPILEKQATVSDIDKHSTVKSIKDLLITTQRNALNKNVIPGSKLKLITPSNNNTASSARKWHTEIDNTLKFEKTSSVDSVKSTYTNAVPNFTKSSEIFSPTLPSLFIYQIKTNPERKNVIKSLKVSRINVFDDRVHKYDYKIKIDRENIKISKDTTKIHRIRSKASKDNKKRPKLSRKLKTIKYNTFRPSIDDDASTSDKTRKSQIKHNLTINHGNGQNIVQNTYFKDHLPTFSKTLTIKNNKYETKSMLEPFLKTNLYPIKLMPAKIQRKVMRRMQFNKKETALATRQSAASMTNNLFNRPKFVHKSVSANTRQRVLKPTFENIDRAKTKLINNYPQTVYRQNDRDFYKEDFETHHKLGLTWKEKVNYVQEALKQFMPNPRSKYENVIEKPFIPNNKPGFLRDRIDSVRSYLYEADYAKPEKGNKDYFLKTLDGPTGLEPPYAGERVVEETTKKRKKTRRKRRTLFFLSPTVPYNRYF
uniref:Uncharacterized protein n=1 Tax=Bombyx mori TaxID=7091 RepID=A0A8R2QS24_BOMMO|nr:putative uncharacterized protein DDB_G0282133 [Bombyx mori]